MTTAIELNRMSAFELDSVNGGTLQQDFFARCNIIHVRAEKQDSLPQDNIIHWTA